MKNCVPILLFAFFAVCSPLHGQNPEEFDLEQKLGLTESNGRLPGIALAEGFSQVTGVAVSPLLGVSAIGTYKYFTTPESQRDQLPWICHPLFWSIGLSILVLCFFKDTIGNIAPAFVKKPLDFLELFEDKFSAVIAGSAFVPFVVQQYTAFSSMGTANEISALAVSEGGLLASHSFGGLATINPAWILTPLAILGFFTVWIVSHAITVLAAISPFRILDVFLKASRLCLLALMAGLYALSPMVAAILSVIVLIICAFLAPRAFRLSVYGTVIGGDALRSLVRKSAFQADKIRGFLVRQGSNRMKKGTYGKLIRKESGRVQFNSKWLFFGATRKLVLPPAEQLVLLDGILMPTIRRVDPENGKEVTIIHLLPSCRHNSISIASELGIEHRETAATRGVQAAKRWLDEMVSRSSIPGISAGEADQQAG